MICARSGEGGQETEVDDYDKDHEFDEVLAHFFEAGDKSLERLVTLAFKEGGHLHPSMDSN
jgi:hypothetical protein